MDRKTLIFTSLICRDESKHIVRSLKDLEGFVDGYVLCDTGSLDNTVELAESYIEDSGKPGKVFKANWENFGKNRTIALRQSESYAKPFFEGMIGFPLNT